MKNWAINMQTYSLRPFSRGVGGWQTTPRLNIDSHPLVFIGLNSIDCQLWFSFLCKTLSVLSTSFIELEWKYRCAQISYSTANFFFASFVGNILYFERCISRKPRCTSNSQIPLNDLDFFFRAKIAQIPRKYFPNTFKTWCIK